MACDTTATFPTMTDQLVFALLFTAVEDGINLTELDPDFLKKMADIRSLVAKRLAEPHFFGGEVVLGGFILSTLMTRVCETVNERGKDVVPCR